MKKFDKYVKRIIDKMYGRFEEKGSGNMLLITAITGFTLSTLAQTGAIIANKKYSTSEKAFMVPQELTEGLINIFSMILITRPIQRIAKKFAKTGKILTKEMKEYLKEKNLLDKRGDADFDVRESINTMIKGVKESDVFIKSTKLEQEKMLSEHTAILREYEALEDSTSAIMTTAGGMLSATLIAPVLRNAVASDYQKINMDVINQQDELKRQIYAYKLIKSHVVPYSGMLTI